MSTRHNKVPALLLLLAAAMLIAAITGCERKVEGTVAVEESVSDQCFNCHNGQVNAQQGEWANSVHASGYLVDYTSRGYGGCVNCHNQDGFVEFLESGTSIGSGNATAIGCFACHDPHDNGNFNLRTTAAVTLVDATVFDKGTGNICANCHHSRSESEIDPDSSFVVPGHWGPHHGPQSDVYMQAVGFEGFVGWTDTTLWRHNNITNACTDCHMQWAEEKAGYDIGGHTFNMEDESGHNLAEGVCAATPCHGSGVEDYEDILAKADHDNNGATEAFMLEIEGMLDSLGALLQAKGVLDIDFEATEDDTIADGRLAGAAWNYMLIREDGSHGVHSPEYAFQLLDWSWQYVRDSVP